MTTVEDPDKEVANEIVALGDAERNKRLAGEEIRSVKRLGGSKRRSLAAMMKAVSLRMNSGREGMVESQSEADFCWRLRRSLRGAQASAGGALKLSQKVWWSMRRT